MYYRHAVDRSPVRAWRLPMTTRGSESESNARIRIRDSNRIHGRRRPVVLHSAIVSAIYMFSQALHYSRIGGGTVVARLLGTWKATNYSAVPVGGLAYYVTAPSSLTHVVADPLHALAYAALLLTSCALLSQAWTTASGSSAKDVARYLADQRLALPGTHHDHAAIHSQLRRYIPTAAALGGLCVGALTILADVTGAIGSGTGILLAATVVYNLIDNFGKEEITRL